MKLYIDVYLRLSNSVLFPIYEKKKKKLSFGKGLFGRWWLFAGGLWSFADVSSSFSGSLCWLFWQLQNENIFLKD